MTQLTKHTNALPSLYPEIAEKKALELVGIQNREILLAANAGAKVREYNDRDRERLVSVLVAEGLLKLGHKNQFTSQEDLRIFCTTISNDIKEKWSFLTDAEVKLVFKMGVRGDFAAEPKPGEAKEVVFLNQPNINGWFKAYKYTRKSEAYLEKQKYLMAVSREAPAAEQSEAEGLELKIETLEKEMERLSQGEPYREFDLGNVLLTWLEGLGLINLTDSAKLEILNRERAMLRTERKNDALDLPTKITYKQFAAAVEGGTHASGNRYELEAKNNARKAVFRGFILSVLESGDDIRTLIMEQEETNRRDTERLESMDTAGLEQEALQAMMRQDRHRLALVQRVLNRHQKLTA